MPPRAAPDVRPPRARRDARREAHRRVGPRGLPAADPIAGSRLVHAHRGLVHASYPGRDALRAPNAARRRARGDGRERRPRAPQALSGDRLPRGAGACSRPPSRSSAWPAPSTTTTTSGNRWSTPCTPRIRRRRTSSRVTTSCAATSPAASTTPTPSRGCKKVLEELDQQRGNRWAADLLPVDDPAALRRWPSPVSATPVSAATTNPRTASTAS